MLPSVGRLLLAILATAATVTAGCGDGEDASGAAAAQSERSAFVTLSEIESVFEARLAVVRTGREDAASADDVDPRPVDSARYETQSGKEFDVFVFASTAAARAARPSILETAVMEAGGASTRAANVVAMFDERPRSDALRRAWNAMRALRDACVDEGEPNPTLRRLCRHGDLVPPRGGAVDRDEAARIGAEIVVNGFGYDPAIARQLNPRVVPDREMVGDRRAARGRTFFGVFVTVCNYGDTAAAPSNELALVDAFGKRIRPVGLGAQNPFAYRPVPLEPRECLPPANSVADRAASGALVLFEVPYELFDERPLALEVTGGSGERRRVLLDL